MPDDFAEDPHFIDVDADLGGDGLGVMSRNALNLLLHGTINSVAEGTPGFVSDEYLNAISAETTIAAAELEAAGLWERRPGGYFVRSEDLLQMVIDQNEQVERTQTECAQRGSHTLPEDADDTGWVLCSHCAIPLQRPDGGPVALPHGGPLGPDPRNP